MTTARASATAEVSPRALVLSETYPPDRGGMAQSCDRIVRNLRARGLDVDVAHLGARQRGLRVERHERGRLFACEVGEDPAHALNLLWTTLDRAQPRPTHLVAFGGLLPLLAGPPLAAWLQVPLVTLLRGNDFDTGIFSPSRGWMLREALARAACACVVSRDHERRVGALFPETPVRWIPNGIDAAEWSLHGFDRERARRWRADHVQPGRRVVGLFGHLKRKKGGAFLLDALARSGMAERLHLLVVGEVEPDMLAELTAASQPAAYTHVPFVDRLDLLPWYAACDLMVVPSLYDGMPNVVLEAGALGIPVLGSRAGGMADLLHEGDTAITFAPGDVHECRRALEHAATLPGPDLHALGARLQALVLGEFHHRIEAARYHQVLLDTAGTPATPGTMTAPRPTATEA